MLIAKHILYIIDLPIISAQVYSLLSYYQLNKWWIIITDKISYVCKYIPM